MTYILYLQKWIYNVYKICNCGKLTKADKKKLEIAVKVEKGSSEIVFSLVQQIEAINMAVANMSGSQIMTVAITLIATGGLVAITKGILDFKVKHLQQKAETQRLQVLAETVGKINEEASRDKQATLQMAEQILCITNRAEKEALLILRAIGEENRISINDTDIPHEPIVDQEDT